MTDNRPENNPRPSFAGQTTDERRAELRRLLAVRAAAESQPTRHSLSEGQQALWLAHQVAADSPVGNAPPIVLRIRPDTGSLDVTALRRALDALVSRHAALRTTYQLEGSEPRQTVHPPAPADLTLIDARAWDENALGERLTEIIQQPFDLGRGVFRAYRFQRPAGEFVLALAFHHIAVDMWSGTLLLDDLLHLYESFHLGKPPALKAPTAEYTDFVRWQSERLAGDEGERLWAYWRDRLTDLPTLDLPADFSRPSRRSFRGAARTKVLAPDLVQRIRDLARDRGVTPFTILLAAYAALLARYTGQIDIPVGSPVAGRDWPPTEDIVGYFANIVVLRLNLPGNPTVRDLLEQTRGVVLDAIDHAEYPFKRLVERLRPVRDPSRPPLVSVAFGMERANRPTFAGTGLLVAGQAASELRVAGLRLTPFPFPGCTAEYDLLLLVEETRDGFAASFQYATDLFEVATIERMAGHFERMLAGLTGDPNIPAAAIDFLTGDERRALEVWNDTATDYPAGLAIHTLFQAQAERRPDAVAVHHGEVSLTYRDLNHRAEALAGVLRARGVRPESVVGVCLPRSVSFVVSVLACLKAGGAYLPLDPANPPERSAFLLGDAGAAVVLTESAYLPALPADDPRVVCLDGDSAPEQSAAAQADGQPGTETGAGNLAYVMYTSGSTGQPKGTLIPHQAIARLVCDPGYVQITPDDRVAFASNVAFDAATFEIWGPLLNGASLVVADQETLLAPRALADWARAEGITTLFLTTALFNTVAAEAPDAFGSLRHLLFGGETVDPDAVRTVLQTGPPQRLLHVYGPTETTTFAAWHEVKAVPHGATTVPIGLPIANTDLHVLDGHLRPATAGAPGELFIGGPGLARGYLGRAALTAERFVPHPFSREPSARLYRTGDLVRRRSDGVIEFLGRADRQVKLRGFRIEPGEIEAALRQHPGVRNAAVLVREVAGRPELVAYLVSDSPPDAAGIRAELGRRLPAYLIPTAYVPVAALPLTPNGKLDRAALPDPTGASRERGGYEPPGSPVEVMLAEIWAGVLGLDQIGIHDDFFALGGTSLLATRVASRVRDACGVNLPLAVIFEQPTLGGLSAAVETLRWLHDSPVQQSGRIVEIDL